MASSTTSGKTRSRKSGNDGANVRNRAAAPAASATTATEDVGSPSKHDKRVDTLMAAVRKATKAPVGLKESTMANRLILTIGGATAAWLWISRGQLNAASSRTGLDIKGVGVNMTLAQSAAEIVKRNSASPGRGAGAKATPAKAKSASKTSTRKRASGGKAPANGGDLTTALQPSTRGRSGNTSGSRSRRRSR